MNVNNHLSHVPYKNPTKFTNRKRLLDHVPMSVEAARRATDGVRIQQTRRVISEALPTPNLREEELMQLRTTEQLLPYLQAAVRRRFLLQEGQLMGAVDIAIIKYAGHKKRRDGTESALHPIRTFYRALMEDPELTPVNGAVLALHDTIEDCNVTQGDLEVMLRMRDQRFSDGEIRDIADGANQLSRIQNGQKLFPHEYIQQLEDTHRRNPKLRIPVAKTWDAYDNVRNDIWMLIHDSPNIDPQRVLTFLAEKADDVLTLARGHEPDAVSTALLAKAIHDSKELALRELKIRELQIRENEIKEAGMRRRPLVPRRRLPTARAPALSPIH